MNNTCIYTCVLWKTICIFCGVKLAKLAELLWVLTRDKSVANLRSLHSRFYLLPDSVVIWNKNFSIKTKVLHVEFFVVVVFSFFCIIFFIRLVFCNQHKMHYYCYYFIYLFFLQKIVFNIGIYLVYLSCFFCICVSVVLKISGIVFPRMSNEGANWLRKIVWGHVLVVPDLRYSGCFCKVLTCQCT